MLGISSSFGTWALAGGAAVHSRAIRLEGVHAGTGPLIVKLVGTDMKGRRLAAWGEINNSDPQRETDPLRPLAGIVR